MRRLAVLGTLAIVALAVPLATGVTVAEDGTLARDGYARTGTNGWRNAPLGGEYLHSGKPQDFSVNGSVGNVSVRTAGTGRAARLSNVYVRDVNLVFRVKSNKAASGGQYVTAVLRRTSAGNEYRARLRFAPDGAVWGSFWRIAGRGPVAVGGETRIEGISHEPGVWLNVRAKADDKNPTALKLKAWRNGASEPASWDLEREDGSSADIESRGTVGVRVYLSGAANNAPVTFSFDDLEANVVGGTLPDPTPTPDPSPTPDPTPPPDPSPDPIPTDSFVVAPNGDDDGPGTAERPWATLQKAANAVPAGGTVLIRAGTYLGFTVTRSGQADDPTVFTAYPGDARPVVNSGGSRLDVIKINGARDIKISKLTIEGAAGGNWAGAGIRTENGARDITILDNVIRNNRSFGINLHSSTSITVRDNDISNNEQGIQVAREGAGTRILDNQVHHNDRMLRNTPRSEDANDDAGAAAIGFLRSTGNVTVSGNRIWGNRARSYDYEWDGSAFEIYGASNVSITDNVVWDNENVLETGTDSGTPCAGNQFVRNVAYGATTEGRSWGMFLRCAQDMRIANNTFYRLDGFVFSIGYGSTTYSGRIDGLEIVNNVAIMGSGKIYGFESSVPDSVKIDRNLIHSDTGPIAQVPGRGSTTSLQTFREWTGYERTGLDASPQFVDAADRDFRLTSGSPAVDRGVVVPGVTEGYTGAAPDLGRFERD